MFILLLLAGLSINSSAQESTNFEEGLFLSIGPTLSYKFGNDNHAADFSLGFEAALWHDIATEKTVTEDYNGRKIASQYEDDWGYAGVDAGFEYSFRFLKSLCSLNKQSIRTSIT